MGNGLGADKLAGIFWVEEWPLALRPVGVCRGRDYFQRQSPLPGRLADCLGSQRKRLVVFRLDWLARVEAT